MRNEECSFRRLKQVEQSRGQFDMTIWPNIQIQEEAEQILWGE